MFPNLKYGTWKEKAATALRYGGSSGTSWLVNIKISILSEINQLEG